jgi:hypothetical protein
MPEAVDVGGVEGRVSRCSQINRKVRMTDWIVSRSLSKKHDLKRGGAGLIYHVQARTADQLCSFAMLCSESAPLTRQKAADGIHDVFTCMSDQGHATMNVIGKIRYEGSWPK